METFSYSELSYLIQEGRGETPEVRETLVRQFAPELYKLAYALTHIDSNKPGASLDLVIHTFRTALARPKNLQLFDTPRTWLFNEMFNLRAGKQKSISLQNRKLKSLDWQILLLRYNFQLSLIHIAEALGIDEDKAAQKLRKNREDFSQTKSSRGRGHTFLQINDALDGYLSWQDADKDAHLEVCDKCRQYLGELQRAENEFIHTFSEQSPAPITQSAIETILVEIEKPADNNQKSKIKAPQKEVFWIAGAITFFLFSSLALNPLWTPPPATPTPAPTNAPAEELANQFREFNYDDLENALLLSPAPAWKTGAVYAGEWIPTTDVSFSPDGRFAVFGAGETIVIWDLAQNIQTTINSGARSIIEVEFLGKGKFTTLDNAGVLDIWEIANNTKRYSLSEDPPIQLVAPSKNDNLFVTASEEIISFWEIFDDTLVRTRQISADGSRALALSSNGQLLATVDAENTISIWDLADFTFQIRFEVGMVNITSIQFSPNGNRIAAADAAGNIHVYGLTRPLGSTLSGIKVFEFDHPGSVLDFAWLEGGSFLAALSGSETESNPPQLFLWEMNTGLPAASPALISQEKSLNGLEILEENRLALSAGNGAILFPDPVPVSDIPIPTEFTLSKTEIFPTEILFQTSKNPFTKPYSQTLESVSALIALNLPLEELIPQEYIFIGADYEPENQIATYLFSRTMAPNNDERIVLRIRPRIFDGILNLQEDWISPSSDFRHIQIGKYLGERVTGEWVQAPIDNNAPGIFRWSKTPITRFRWTMGAHLFELVSDSSIATAQIRWDRFFQPLAAAIISGDDQTPLFDYFVEDGDTCIDISARFGTSVGRLAALNNLDPECMIITGTILQIPIPPPQGVYDEVDLNCDGTPERLRLIPSPLQPNTDVYFGLVIDALPEGGNAPEAEYASYDRFTIADVNVAFFRPPSVIDVENACGKLIAITGYGGNGEESGLRFFAWTGDQLRLLLRTDGFLDEEIFDKIHDGLQFTTRRLEYDRTQAACTLLSKTFAWNNNTFTLRSTELEDSVDCFEGFGP